MNCSVYFLSDCHFSEDFDISNEKIVSFSTIIKNDLNEYIYFVISGDIAFSGKFIEYEKFISFFNEIVKKSGKEIKLITCPGNHDINFNNQEYTLSSLIEDTNKYNIRNSYIKRISLMASYYTFENNYVKAEKDDDYLSHISFYIDSKKITFYILNNVLFSCYGKTNSSDDTKNHAYLSQDTIAKIKRNSSSEFIFLLMHFPISFFNEQTAHNFKEKLSNVVNILLNGHVHILEENAFLTKNGILNLQGNYFMKNSFDDNGSFIKIDLKENVYHEFKWSNGSYIQEEIGGKIYNKLSRWNSYNICFNNEYYEQISKCQILEKEFNVEDIFVFPYLCKEKYNKLSDKDSFIRKFDDLLQKIKNNPYIFIYGEDGIGKSILSKYLTLLLFKEDYFPILCDGKIFRNANNIKTFINKQIRTMYTDSCISKFFNEIPISKKILIVDDYEDANNNLLFEINNYFKSIIMLSRVDPTKVINNPIYINDHECLEYNIQPMVKTKRKEFSDNLYLALNSQGEKSNLTKEKFFALIENQLETLAINDVCDPVSLAYLEINIYRYSDSFDNTLFSNVNQARALLTLNDILKKNKIDYSIESINRILASIAYSMYINNKHEITNSDIENAIKEEQENYGNSGIKLNVLSKIIIDAFILKELENRNLTFFNRDIFSYYIALFINLELNEGKESSFTSLLKKDLFIPLNFNILLCLASIYKSSIIPNKIIDLLYSEANQMPLLSEENFSIDGITKEKKEELKKLTEEDIKKINETQDENERKKHVDYTKNIDNLYYVDAVSAEVKDILTWLDKLKICCVLLKNFSNNIKKDYKEKLIELIVSLPNLVLYKFNEYLFKELDNIFAALKDNKNDKIAVNIDAFNNYIITLKRGFILSTYEYGSRSFNDRASKNLLKMLIVESDSQLKQVQNLMLKSYILDENSFIDSCTKLIKDNRYKENSFIKMSAKLIGRRYIIENYELCSRKYQSFINLIFESPKEALKAKNQKFIKKQGI